MKLAPLAIVFTLFLQAAPAPPAPEDFAQWERLAAVGERGGLSPDGRWLVYGINRTNGDNELRVTAVPDGTTKVVAFTACRPSRRRAKKDVVLLVYGGEDHGMRQKANQIDYHHRILDWFGHYRKGEPAKPWITSGVTFLDKDKVAPKKIGSS